MSLIKCPECNSEVSDKAIACPKCAYPISEKKKIPEKKVTVNNAKEGFFLQSMNTGCLMILLFIASIIAISIIIGLYVTVYEGVTGN